MINIYLQLGLYYFAVIVGIFLHRYFSQFIASNFQNSRSLKIKRRWGIAYFYCIAIWCFYMIDLIGNSGSLLNDNIFTLSMMASFGIILIYFAYIVVSLESPKKSHKKRKWTGQKWR